MSISYQEKERIFQLDTPGSSYILGLADEEGFTGHIYYGRKLGKDDFRYLLRTKEPPFLPSENRRDRNSFLDSFPMEYPGSGGGDYREGAIGICTKTGKRTVLPLYKGHKIYSGKPGLEGLPATFGQEEDCDTLELTLEDKALALEMVLFYTAFRKLDVITRSVQVRNQGSEELYLTKVMSASLDMDNQEFDLVTLQGSWARERRIQRQPVALGKQGIGSVRGVSSHQANPFLALTEKNAGQKQGEVYGMNLVYSGNFFAQTERNQFDSVRVMMGIHPEQFCWKLEPGEHFQAPEAVLTYSCEGFGKMTRTFHDLYRNHLIRGAYRNEKRPILINNWEATYFDFDTEKLLEIAREAAGLGIEMLVMDDGWFGRRADDNTSLGDWEVNEEKIAGGLKDLVDKVNRLGMKFGIWFEPEMVSPDSDLYRQHPDWAIQVPGRTPSLARNQLVLDLSRQEVLDCIYEKVAKVLRSANIEYVKWDMNRQLNDMGSLMLPPDRQGELYHRYVLAVYELQRRLTEEFPHILLENCASGGGRFDAGMLYYSPQIWCSDNTDAIERLSIQEGTAMVYPLSSIGSHVSDCPNHLMGRNVPFETRGYVALAGTFGYELDVTRISQADREMIPEQVAMYHKYNDLIRTGDYYRIASYQENHEYDCYQVVSKDKKESLVTFIQALGRANCRSRRIFLEGLEPECRYRIEGKARTYRGDTLMYAGLNVESMEIDYQGKLFYLRAV